MNIFCAVRLVDIRSDYILHAEKKNYNILKDLSLGICTSVYSDKIFQVF